MTAPATFRQSDITRAMKGARAAGFRRVQVHVDRAGNIVVDASDDPAPLQEERRNPLDRLLEGR